MVLTPLNNNVGLFFVYRIGKQWVYLAYKLFCIMRFIIRVTVTSLAVFLLATLLPGVQVQNLGWAILVSVVLVLMNVYVKPLLVFLTLPITVFTLGFFLLVINACIILMTSHVLKEGFKVDGFWIAFLFSILLSMVTSLMERMIDAENDRGA
jgi:putative membrane protein